MKSIFNRDMNGKEFNEDIIEKIWEKGIVIEGNYPSLWRKDMCGSFINRNEYGNRISRYGWVIDHIRPLSLNGDDQLQNLQPLQWENDIKKGENFPWKCPE